MTNAPLVIPKTDDEGPRNQQHVNDDEFNELMGGVVQVGWNIKDTNTTTTRTTEFVPVHETSYNNKKEFLKVMEVHEDKMQTIKEQS